MKRELAWILLGVVILPSVLALDMAISVNEAFSMVGRIIYDALSNEWVSFGITIIVLIVLFYNIYLAGLAKVPSLGESKTARSIAVSLSILSVLGIVYMKLKSGANVHGFLESILGPSGLYAAIFITGALFFWFRHSLGKRWAWPLSGLVGYSVGSMVNQPIMMSIGLLAGLIGFVFSFKSDGYKKYNDKTEGFGSKNRVDRAEVERIKGRLDGLRKDAAKLSEDEAREMKKALEDENMVKKIEGEIKNLEGLEINLEKKEEELEQDERKTVESMEKIIEQVKNIDSSLKVMYSNYRSTRNPNLPAQINSLLANRKNLEQAFRQLQARLNGDQDNEERLLRQSIEVEEREVKDEEGAIDEEVKADNLILQAAKEEDEREKDVPASEVRREHE